MKTVPKCIIFSMQNYSFVEIVQKEDLTIQLKVGSQFSVEEGLHGKKL